MGIRTPHGAPIKAIQNGLFFLRRSSGHSDPLPTRKHKVCSRFGYKLAHQASLLNASRPRRTNKSNPKRVVFFRRSSGVSHPLPTRKHKKYFAKHFIIERFVKFFLKTKKDQMVFFLFLILFFYCVCISYIEIIQSSINKHICNCQNIDN